MAEPLATPKANGNGNGHSPEGASVAPTEESLRWSWDRRIPLALIITLVMQTAVAAAAWGALQTTVQAQAQAIAKLEAASLGVTPLREDIAALKVQVQFMSVQQARIESKLDGIATSSR